MTTEENNQDVTPDTPNEGGEEQPKEESNTITLNREEYDVLKKAESDFGSLKRDHKNLQKEIQGLKEKPAEATPEKTTEEFGLLQKLALKSEGISDEDEVELAKKIQQETNLSWDKLVESKYFKSELEELRTQKANEQATAGVKGDGGKGSEAKQTAEYWLAKGVPPTKEDVPDRKKRAEIARAFITKSKPGFKFYNE